MNSPTWVEARAAFNESHQQLLINTIIVPTSIGSQFFAAAGGRSTTRQYQYLIYAHNWKERSIDSNLCYIAEPEIVRCAFVYISHTLTFSVGELPLPFDGCGDWQYCCCLAREVKLSPREADALCISSVEGRMATFCTLQLRSIPFLGEDADNLPRR